MLRLILHIPYLNDIRDADSRSGRTLTDSWWGNGFGTEPSLPCILHRLPLWHNFIAARLQIGNYGASLYINSSLRVKPSPVSNSICGSDSSIQHADRSLREKASLCEQGMTHKTLHTRHCPLHLLMVNGNPIQRHSKERRQPWRNPRH